MLTEKDFYDYFAEETISIGFVSTHKPEEPFFLITNTIFLDSWQVSCPKYIGVAGGLRVRAINHLCHHFKDIFVLHSYFLANV